jgi:hypothetical protein
MAGTQNQAAGRVGGPQGTNGIPSNVQVNGSGTTPLVTSNGPAQTLSPAQVQENYVQSLLVTTHFLGIEIRVHKEVSDALAKVETVLDYKTNQQKHGIATIRGKQGVGAGVHAWGCAIDVNYETSPYLMREEGESALDAALVPVYNRISNFVLGRASVIPLDIAHYNGTLAQRDALYNSLKEEDGAMRKYFGVYMRDPSGTLAPYLATPAGSANAKKTAWAGATVGAVPDVTTALKQIQEDWTTLSGRSNGPQILLASSPGGSYSQWQNPCDAGMCYPQALTYSVEAGQRSAPDAPFVSKGGVIRDPSNGFLGFDHEVVTALCNQGFTWGAIGFGTGNNGQYGGSGDVMHFELADVGRRVGQSIKRLLAGGAP